MGGSVSLERYAELLPHFTKAMSQAECNTVRRVAMWVAQLGHESAGLKYMEEIWGPTPQQQKYDPASGSSLSKSLGNTSIGDGHRYRGRGPLQVTGKSNYARLSQWAYENKHINSPTLFVEKPDLLSTVEYGFLGAVWFWTVHRINSYADDEAVTAATRVINGGTNGLSDRQQRYSRSLRYGKQLLTGDGLMSAKDDIIGFIKAYVGPLISDVKDIREQLTGGRDLIRDAKGRIDLAKSYPGWRVLGQRPDGSNNTLVDAIGVLIAESADQKARIEALERK